jgi:hypothetical protein
MNPSTPWLNEATRGDEAALATGSGPRGIGPALRSSRRYDSLEEGDDGTCEDVIPITGNHMGGVRHVHILGVRTLGEKTLGPCLT